MRVLIAALAATSALAMSAHAQQAPIEAFKACKGIWAGYSYDAYPGDKGKSSNLQVDAKAAPGIVYHNSNRNGNAGVWNDLTTLQPTVSGSSIVLETPDSKWTISGDATRFTGSMDMKRGGGHRRMQLDCKTGAKLSAPGSTD